MLTEPPPEADGPRLLRDLPKEDRRAFLLGAMIVSLPFVVGAVSAYRSGWFPTGDTATQLIGARQVFSHRPPLVGQVTSSVNYGPLSFHPGPALFYLFAPFVRLFGDSAGMLAAATALKVSALVLIGYVALRVRTISHSYVAWCAALGVALSLGGVALLYDPFYSIVAVPLLLLFLFLCWAVMSGDIRLMPLWVVVATILIQASIQFGLVLAAPTALLVVTVARRRRGAQPDGAHPTPSLGRALTATTIALAVVMWIPPIAEAAAHRGGNMVSLYQGVRAATTSTVGVRSALRYAAQALLFAPARTSQTRVGAAGLALAAALTVAMAVAVATRWRTLPATARRALTVAVGAEVGAIASVAISPSDGYQLFRLLSLSVATGFWWFAVISALAPRIWRRAGTAGWSPRRGWPIPAAVTVVLAALVAVPLPVDPGRQYATWTFDAVREMGPELLSATADSGDGHWFGDFAGPRSLFVVTFGLRAYLEDHGVTTNTYRPSGVGWSFERDGIGARSGNFIVVPDMGQAPPPAPWRRVASYRPDGWDETAALASARRAAAFADHTGAVLTEPVVQAVPRFTCPQLVVGERCTDAQVVRPGPVGELPPWIVALLYVERAERDYPFPTLVGPAPPRELLRTLRRNWTAIPVVVFAETTA